MTCSVCGTRSRRGKSNVEVSGTWDYKWPRGSSIRVAFQRPKEIGDSDFADAVKRVTQLAGRWEIAIASYLEERREHQLAATDFFSNGIRLNFSPRRTYDTALGDTAPTGSELRSPYVQQDIDERDYDVLISLEDLPLVRRDPFRAPVGLRLASAGLADEQDGIQRIDFPFSELGCYARHVDYGQPTAFLGRPAGFFRETKEKGKRLLEYLNSVAGAYAVVHEFGHVLGLAHAHQTPQLADTPFRSVAELQILLGAAFDSGPIEERFIREQIVLRWRGSLEFSDWLDSPPLAALSSIMAPASLADFLAPKALPRDSKASAADAEMKGKALAAALRKPESDMGPGEGLAIPVQPTAYDIQSLLLMYAGQHGPKLKRAPYSRQSAVVKVLGDSSH